MGCAADWIGNLFWLLQTKYPGGNVKERVRQLWMDIDAAYKRDDDRLQNLIDKMIKQEKKAPKLRCSGSVGRMDGWTDGRLDGRAAGRTGGWTD